MSDLLTRKISELGPEILNETYMVLEGIGRGSQNCISFSPNAPGCSKNGSKWYHFRAG